MQTEKVEMTGDDFKSIRESLQMTQTELASLFGCKNYQIVHLWEKGKSKIPSLNARIMLALSSMKPEHRESFIKNLSGITH